MKDQLTSLRLSTAAIEINEILAKEKRAVSLSWISQLLAAEIDARKEKSLKSRIKRADFPETTTMEGFDWNFNKDIDQAKIEELSGLDFLKNNGIALFLGKPGTGKTHLALAIGGLAARAGYNVICTSSKRLSNQILNAKLTNNLDHLFKRYLSANLWIFDDWGVVSMSREIAEEVFDLLDRRKHSSALILTSNRDIDEWARVFPDQVLASATIDRLFDRADILLFRGPSYRLKGRIEIKNIDYAISKTPKQKISAGEIVDS